MKRLLTLGACAAALPLLATAATDGSLGDTSTGTLTFTLTVTDPAPTGTQIRITGLTDFEFDATVGDVAAPIDQSINLCVYMDNSGTYNAEVTATALEDAASTLFPYSFEYLDTISTTSISGTVDTDAGVTQSQAALTPSNTLDCTTGDAPATLTLGIPAVPAAATTATGSITITVSPD